MTQTVVITETLAESGTAEEALNELIVDAAFTPQAPHAGLFAAYKAGSTYAKGDLVEEGGVVYRSQKAANKGNTPKEDADFTNWAPAPDQTYLLQNSSFFHAARTDEQRSNVPPARSDALAAPAETIGVGEPPDLGY